jgi:hypothetical protein
MSLAIVVGYYSSKEFGMYGIIIPITLAMFTSTIINNVLFVKFFQFDIISFYKESFLYQIVFTAVFMSLSILVKNNFIVDDWFKFLITGFAYSMLYVLLYALLLLTKEEKSFLLKIRDLNS